MGKKWTALLLAALMLLSLGATAFGAEEDSHLTVGNTTEMRGNFFTEMWGNTTSDIDVQELLHGCDLIRWDGEKSMFTYNPAVVQRANATESPNGDRTFTFVLQDDLRYSDGSPITAWDYAFSYLLVMSPELKGCGATPLHKDYLVGGEAYAAGRTKVLSGVRVLNNRTLTVTLSQDYLPFFYEVGLLSCQPYPISEIAPGVKVRDDGKGVYLDGVFTAAVLDGTLNGPSGYRTHPTVVSGPYVLKSFDGVTAEFESNPYYPGNADGEKPLINKLTYTLAKNDTMMDKLFSGEFDLLNKVISSEAVTKGIQQIGYGEIGMSNYQRTGLSYVAFACEQPAVSSVAVRQAIAYCMDRDAITEAYSGEFGQRVDGYYGIGQWMFGLISGAIEPPVKEPANPFDATAKANYERELKRWESLSLDGLDAYEVSVEKAAGLLAGDGWQLNADGVQEKWINGRKVALDLTLAYPEGNQIGEYFVQYLVPNLQEVGIKMTLKPVSMTELHRIAYSGEERDVELFYQASNFDRIFDPAVYFEVRKGQPGEWSFTRQTDAELYRRALAMRETKPGDVLSYMQKWVLFQQRVNETLPIIPVYSNTYFDFYTSRLQDYDIEQKSTWPSAILGAVKADIPANE